MCFFSSSLGFQDPRLCSTGTLVLYSIRDGLPSRCPLFWMFPRHNASHNTAPGITSNICVSPVIVLLLVAQGGILFEYYILLHGSRADYATLTQCLHESTELEDDALETFL